MSVSYITRMPSYSTILAMEQHMNFKQYLFGFDMYYFMQVLYLHKNNVPTNLIILDN